MKKSDISLDAPVRNSSNSIHPIKSEGKEHEDMPLVKLPTFRKSLGAFISDTKIETTLLIVIIVYSVLIFIRIGVEDDYEEMTLYLNVIELIILLMFVAEFVLKIYAFRIKYFKEGWNVFDMFVVILCLVLTIIDLTDPDLVDYTYFRISGTLRLLRLAVLFRRLNLMRKIAQIKQARTRLNAINVSTSAEKVVEILQAVVECDIPDDLKRELRWALHVISQNTLFELNIEANNEDERNKVKEWIDQPQVIATVMNFSQSRNIENTIDLSEEVEKSCANIENLSFNIFEFVEDELLYVCLFVFKKNQLLAFTEPSVFKNFILYIQNGYKDNPYHNSKHAADVVQFFYFLLTTCGGSKVCGLDARDETICLLSAAIHDFEHPGRTNNFLINTGSDLATLYNDKSVLENHHIAAAFAAAKDPDKNIFQNLRPEQAKVYRSKMISIVLATDMSRHFEDHGKFKNRFTSHHDMKDDADKLIVMEALMHAADISNPTREWSVCKRWSYLLIDEFFSQGDEERSLGLPISHLCDRHTVDLASSQIGFIDVIIEPTFLNLALVLPQVNHLILPNIHENKENWGKLGNSNTGAN